MPNTSSSIHDDSAGDKTDEETSRERYIADGRIVAAELAKDDNVSAIWLSGPFEMPRIAPSSDLHMAVLLAESDHVFYRHVLPELSPVGRRLEIAFFPLESFRRALERGCSDWPSVFDAHKLNDIVVLFDRDRALAEMRRALEEFKPSNMFIGAELRILASDLAAAKQLLHERLYEDCILKTRVSAWRAAELFLVAGAKKTFSKISQIYPSLRSIVSQSAIRTFEEVHDIDKIGNDKAKGIIAEASGLVSDLFGRRLP